MFAEITWNVATVAVVAVFSVPIVAILAGTWRHIEKTRSDNILKRDMINRGMSADEIERVLAAKSSK